MIEHITLLLSSITLLAGGHPVSEVSSLSFFPHLTILCTSVVDPDPHGSALIWLSWICIRIGNADPDSGAWKMEIDKKLSL
jgi:hypothetical protein